MHDRSPHPRRRAGARAAFLPALLATALLAPAAAHATPPGGNGDLFANWKESYNYTLYDPVLTPSTNPGASWGDGEMRAAVRSSPDGVHVAFLSVEDDRIAYGDVDGTIDHLIAGTAGADDLAFSPDGATIAFTRNDHVWTAPVNGSSAPHQLGGTLTGARGIDWASDGGAIVVSAAGAGGDRDLYALDPATGAGHPLTATASIAEDAPSFAPDGSRLAFSVSDGTAAHDRVDVADADGANRHPLVAESGADWPQWSPDGTRVAFTTRAGTDGETVATIKPDGTGRHAVASPDVVALSWLIERGTGNHAPVAAFTVDPAQPFAGGDTTLTGAATDSDGTIASERWDLDGDGQYDDATGHVAHTTFATAGAHTVRLKVKDNSGTVATAEQTLTVLAAGMPGASFAVDPANPIINHPATFTAAPNTDPAAHVVHHEWDFDGDGTFDADTGEARTVQHTYTSIGPVTAKLRVTDADGDQATTSVSFDVRDEVRCGTERLGRLVFDGCLVVKGDRRVAPTGVTVNGFTFGGSADGPQLAIDTTNGRAFAIEAAQAQDFLNGRLDVPGQTVPALPVSSCGEALGTSHPNIGSFAGGAEADFALAPDKRFAGLAPR
ncbi:MAG TPA: PKD domain-containing protein, partial [Baekduia sp.]|nr:PKD domain-containing protein [Baekduia sp.]